jgi:hypothetical protein
MIGQSSKYSDMIGQSNTTLTRSQHLFKLAHISGHGTQGADDLGLALAVAHALARELGEVQVAQVLEDVLLLHLELGLALSTSSCKSSKQS